MSQAGLTAHVYACEYIYIEHDVNALVMVISSMLISS